MSPRTWTTSRWTKTRTRRIVLTEPTTRSMRPRRRTARSSTPKACSKRRQRIVVGRPGADVSHADGRDSAAHAERRNPPRPQDRNHPRRVPPQAAVLRLRDSQRRQGAAPRPSRRAAVRPHGAGLGDRSAGKGSDSRPVAAQPGDARSAVGAQCRRLPRRHQQVAQAARAQGRLEAAQPAPLPGRAAGRRARPAHAADRADDRPARAVQRADRPAQGSDRADEARQEVAGRAQAAADRVPQHPAGLAGNAVQPAQPHQGPQEGLQRVSAGQARPVAKATCGWSCRSPRSTATAACRSWT